MSQEDWDEFHPLIGTSCQGKTKGFCLEGGIWACQELHLPGAFSPKAAQGGCWKQKSSLIDTEADDLSDTTEAKCSAEPKEECPDTSEGKPQWCFDCQYADKKPDSMSQEDWDEFHPLIGTSCQGKTKG